MALMRKANVQTLEPGVEIILRASGKALPLEPVERGAGMVRAAGLAVWCKFILGHPFENLDAVRLIARINPDDISLGQLKVHPMWRYADRYSRSRRVMGLLGLVASHHAPAAEMMGGLVCRRTPERAGMLRARPAAAP